MGVGVGVEVGVGVGAGVGVGDGVAVGAAAGVAVGAGVGLGVGEGLGVGVGTLTGDVGVGRGRPVGRSATGLGAGDDAAIVMRSSGTRITDGEPPSQAMETANADPTATAAKIRGPVRASARARVELAQRFIRRPLPDSQVEASVSMNQCPPLCRHCCWIPAFAEMTVLQRSPYVGTLAPALRRCVPIARRRAPAQRC